MLLADVSNSKRTASRNIRILCKVHISFEVFKAALVSHAIAYLVEALPQTGRSWLRFPNKSVHFPIDLTVIADLLTWGDSAFFKTFY
jgi:hypothetical protein